MPGNLKVSKFDFAAADLLSSYKFQVCFFVNSGSEANDMALTLARLYTGRSDIISLRYWSIYSIQVICDRNQYWIWSQERLSRNDQFGHGDHQFKHLETPSGNFSRYRKGIEVAELL